MGSTIFSNNKAFAVRNPKTGEPVYMLYEETYESNVHPHDPNWSCRYIGGIRGAMEIIFNSASVCEGGMLRSRGGHLAPENYIRRWLDALKAPYVMPDRYVTLTAGSDYMHLLRKDRLPALRTALSGNAKATTLLDQIEQTGEAEVRLHENIDAIVAILQAAEVTPWRLVKVPYDECEMDASLGYAPKKARNFEVEVPEALVVDRDERLLKGPDGHWRAAGWAYSIVGQFVRELWETEMREPGSYRKRIQAYRDAVNNAPPISFPVSVQVDSSDLLDLQEWKASALRQFVDDTPRQENGAFVVDRSNVNEAIHAGRESLIWTPFPAAPAAGTLRANEAWNF